MYSFFKLMQLSSILFSSARILRLNRTLSMRSKKNSLDLTLSPSIYSPRGENQKTYVQYLEDPSISLVLSTGPAGTGKTLFACNTAVRELKRRNMQKIILTRPVVSVEEDIGFLPGSLIAKMDPWTRPIFDILSEFYLKKEIDSMIHSGVIEISPLAYMRGRTYKNSFIIADEMQNSSPNQMMMLTTRIGEGSKMVITGDLKQSDRMVDNGLFDLMKKINTYPDRLDSIRIVEMKNEDILRSSTVSKILDIYQYKPELKLVSFSGNNTRSERFDNDCAMIPNDPYCL